ncbi:uncharacterized protein DNG_10008 [Cephalotrichum gorgonifer]|uniref:F-box domain-containing protein n=1 Tax=Cephalotrichum gorgonifer TaxID=2041049 RepID=A0AAE8N7T6_9PEZI|nr:uncharacterized protein DNG_10008 [Cephalotrichum gorgonifer]
MPPTSQRPSRARTPPQTTAATSDSRPSKRRRLGEGLASDIPISSCARAPRDHLSSLSDELLLRILSYLPLSHLLGVSPVSHRFRTLSADSQLWRQLYYLHFVLPRAMRIPGFRPPAAGHDDARATSRTVMRHGGPDLRRRRAQEDDRPVDWKRQYKLRHNWSRGKCAVEELDVGGDPAVMTTLRPAPPKQTLAKVVDGTAVTADAAAGLRAWDLKTKELLARIELSDDGADEVVPTCMAVDDQHVAEGRLEIAIGFLDGSFGVWALDIARGQFTKRYYHPKSTNGKLVTVAYAFPYLMTATGNVLVSLYAFSTEAAAPETSTESVVRSDPKTPREKPDETLRNSRAQAGGVGSARRIEQEDAIPNTRLPPPLLMTSLKSHSSKAPLALSIRKLATSTTASIAYTQPTREGWTIGIQELHIAGAQARLKVPPEVVQSRIAHAAPTVTGGRRSLAVSAGGSLSSSDSDDTTSEEAEDEYGPMALCYTHPYLLATLPDNTLILYLCTTDAASLSISRGIRLWGHTSGIGDAEITSRGKAVSVSCRGDELRVWELEGRTGGRSVKIRPSPAGEGGAVVGGGDEWDDRRSWVGFDDEMVIVLKEAKSGRESLMVYDFS